MVTTSATQTGSATDEPRQPLSKAELTKKYAADIAFVAGGQGLWFVSRHLYDTRPILQVAMVVGSLIAIGLGVWLWPRKINIIILICRIVLINVGVVALFFGFAAAIAFLAYDGHIDASEMGFDTCFGLTIGSIAPYWLVNIIRAP
ncbi:MULTISPECIES: hypothetical protein [unclassified Pseudovibrio]|uniref:hypothetical protein n=1 Tax=unclassified Pseudovibrio TaxID=2627060 RepID=UPI0007AE9DF7|nr:MULTISPECIES: hypothetical protein [unclassified Pseudovibrio]KZK95033.1 hypothetical protein PsW74_04294 [Pseudovibrio sp. W74]KZL08836.1 hypothetical protein PsAD14_02780 [Pseudovibrio sp. Ad14]